MASHGPWRKAFFCSQGLCPFRVDTEHLRLSKCEKFEVLQGAEVSSHLTQVYCLSPCIFTSNIQHIDILAYLCALGGIHILTSSGTYLAGLLYSVTMPFWSWRGEEKDWNRKITKLQHLLICLPTPRCEYQSPSQFRAHFLSQSQPAFPRDRTIVQHYSFFF